MAISPCNEITVCKELSHFCSYYHIYINIRSFKESLSRCYSSSNTAYINQYSIKTDSDLGVSDFGAIPIKFNFAKAEGHVAYKTSLQNQRIH